MKLSQKQKLMSLPKHARPFCKFDMRGRCRNGTNCPFRHKSLTHLKSGVLQVFPGGVKCTGRGVVPGDRDLPSDAAGRLPHLLRSEGTTDQNPQVPGGMYLHSAAAVPHCAQAEEAPGAEKMKVDSEEYKKLHEILKQPDYFTIGVKENWPPRAHKGKKSTHPCVTLLKRRWKQRVADLRVEVAKLKREEKAILKERETRVNGCKTKLT